MTIKELAARVAKLEQDIALLKQQSPTAEPKKGWQAWVGAFSGDPFMKEAFAIAQEYRERDRRKVRQTKKRKKPSK